MGETIKFTCSRCGHKEEMVMGVGMYWDIKRIFSEIAANARNGKYGEEWKKELKKDPSLTVNVSDEIYICPACGWFKADLNLSLYKPTKKDPFAAFHCRNKYGTDLTLERNPNFRLYKTYPHACAKCNEQMIVHHFWDKLYPVCPECGGKGEFRRDSLWD